MSRRSGAPGYHTRGREGRGDSKVKKSRGLISDGKWLCDCNPRVQAKFLTVKKEGPTKGRHFYVCSKGQGDPAQCNFFLWEEDAKMRENEDHNTANSRPDPHFSDIEPPRGSAENRHWNNKGLSPQAPYQEQGMHRYLDSPTKRARINPRRIEEDGGSPQRQATSEGESETFNFEDGVPQQEGNAKMFSTPEKRKFGNTEFDDINGLVTPVTARNARNDINYPPLNAASSASFTHGTKSNYFPVPNATPTPIRFKDAALDEEKDELITDVMSVLDRYDIQLSPEAADSLRQTLNKHSLKTMGFKRSRDLQKSAVKAKDAKNAELQYRIATLESELETEQATVNHLRWARENGVPEDI